MRFLSVLVCSMLLLLTVQAQAKEGGGGMPATHAEWNNINEEGQTVPQVRNIIGSQGDLSPVQDGKYHIDFKLAWRDDKVGRVTFANSTDLSINKNVVLP